MHTQSRQMALSGVLTALAVVILLLGGLIPLATFCCPMLAILILLPVQAECGRRLAATAWAAVSLLGLLLVPDRELTLFYVFFGCYPLVKPALDRIRLRAVRILCKLLYCSAALVIIYALLILLFQLDAVLAELQAASLVLTLATFVMANVAFLLLDELILRMDWTWHHRLRKRFFRG